MTARLFGRLTVICLAGLVLLATAFEGQAQSRRDLDDELDRFAAALFDRLQPRSIAENVEYCGYLGLDAAGRLTATRAKRGLRDSCEPHEPPASLEVLASYHTHGAYTTEADIEVPSLEDLLGDLEEGIDGYIATPGGRMWLNAVSEGAAFLLCGPGCVVSDPRFRECRTYPPATEYTPESLQQRADNDTGEC